MAIKRFISNLLFLLIVNVLWGNFLHRAKNQNRDFDRFARFMVGEISKSQS